MKWYLDFGHGGKDSGAIGSNNTKESDIVLKIGMLVKSTLEEAFEKVITTRETDKYYSLNYRTNKANKEDCDYFISLHMNSFSNRDVRGCEVWVYDKSSRVYGTSKRICDSLSKALDTPNRGVKVSKNFSVLRKSKMPALLVEVDFLSNPSVENTCNTYDYCYVVARCICDELLKL